MTVERSEQFRCPSCGSPVDLCYDGSELAYAYTCAAAPEQHRGLVDSLTMKPLVLA
jgi:hypothetical protein